MSLKILQIVPAISLVYGGPSQMVRGFSAALARQGVNLTILTTDANGDIGQPPLDVPLDRPVCQQGYQVRYFRCSPSRRYKFSIDLLRWLWKNAPDYDIAHIHALFSPVTSAAAWVARQRGLPYILRPLGTLDPADLQKKKQLKQIYAALLEKGNIAGAAALHFTADREAEISDRFGAKTRDLVIPLGVSPPTKPETDPLDILKSHLPNLKFDRPWILFLSRIEPKKGLDLLIPALEKLLSEGLEFQFILTGSNPQDPEYEAGIQRQIAASPLANCTAIAGFVTGDLKAALLRRADLFVLPSYYENFGIAVAEAMVAGTAVAISDRVHICDRVGESESGWVGACDVESVAGMLKSALENPEECKRRGSNARACAIEHYSWDAIARQTVAAYQSILEACNSKLGNGK
ncbi:glycosyltransferase [Oscillatoriales cyanobacterium LEGE 11467]|uniref:Glycosyltransferase n=2 Tax=Zarconia TaxID=2992130 RepID=A0A928VVF5_9CYAN|nr:glycosyltransferase [Zarconia navalis LEGE 11467]